MDNLLIDIVTKPIYAVISILIVCVIFATYWLFLGKPSKKGMATIELFWFIVVAFNVVYLVADSGKIYFENQSDILEYRINAAYDMFESNIYGGRHCAVYSISKVNPEMSYKSQSRADSICFWVDSIILVYEGINRENFDSIVNIPHLTVSNYENSHSYQSITQYKEWVNLNIGERNNLPN